MANGKEAPSVLNEFDLSRLTGRGQARILGQSDVVRDPSEALFTAGGFPLTPAAREALHVAAYSHLI